MLWRWKVNHKSATEIIFCYSTDKGEEGTFTQAKLQEEYEPNPLTEGAVVNYWFKVKSPHIDGTPDADGYVEVNRKTFTIPKSST